MSIVGEVLLSVRNLAVGYGAPENSTSALAGVDLELARGECLGVAGESGSGKSTLALAVLGLLPPVARVQGGEVRYLGRDLLAQGPAAWRELWGPQMGFVPQHGLAAFDPQRTIGAQLEQVLLLGGTNGQRARTRALELFAEVGLEDPGELARVIPGRLSGGQLQRASIAAAIAREPKLLVADEPTSALDPLHARAIIDLLDGLRRSRGLALLWISHDLRALAARADRVLVLYAGRPVESGPARAVIDTPRHPYTRLLVRSLPDASRHGQRLAALPLPDSSQGARRGACRFHGRCPLADEHCRTWEPAWVADAHGHGLACHYTQKAAQL